MKQVAKGVVHLSEILTAEQWLGKDNELGKSIWENKYRHNNESFPEWLDRVSGGNAEMRQLIAEKKFLFGGRILAGRGLENYGKKLSISNCYVVPLKGDSIEEIFDCAKEMARTYSTGGGVGVDISRLAPRGAKINNAAKTTTGSVSFMDLYSLVTGLICQHGRRGALMISMRCDHPDIEEFIEIKSDLSRVTKANVSVKLTDDFMQAVKDKAKFKLEFTREETGEVISREVDAHKLFKRLAEMSWDYAEPGVLFWDRMEQYNMLNTNDNFAFETTNPCVTGDTLILTDTGYRPIIDCIGIETRIWNGYGWSLVTPRKTGEQRDLVKVAFSNGAELKCTPQHKFILRDGRRVQANKLSVGVELVRFKMPKIDGTDELGDAVGKGENIRIEANTCPDSLPEFVPDATYTVDSRLEWLSGLVRKSGVRGERDDTVTVYSTDKRFLNKARLMLNTLGLQSMLCELEIKKRKRNKNVESNHQGLYGLVFDMYEMFELVGHMWLNSVQPEHCLSTQHAQYVQHIRAATLVSLSQRIGRSKDEIEQVTVTSITPLNEKEDVYCFTDPLNNSGIFNGVITANCGEVPLPAYGACNLGSLNLSEFVTPDQSPEYPPEFDHVAFENAVVTAVRAMNDVLDEGLSLHPLQQQRDAVANWRQIGIGVFGLADMLIKLGVTYGSEKSIELCGEIGMTMATAAIRESAIMAEEHGAYPMCQLEAILRSKFFTNQFNHYDHATIDLVKKHGLRNSQLLSIAPTGSIATMIGVSGGIEPIFANYYTRKTESLHNKDVEYKVYTPIVKAYMDKHGITDDTKLPAYFVTTHDIDVESRIEMQAAWQLNIDSSISSTINLPNTATVEDVERAYMLAWEWGLKGITVYRSGCKRGGILTTDAKPQPSIDGEAIPHNEKRYDYIDPVSKNEIGETYGINAKCKVACGSLTVNVGRDTDGNLSEIYINPGKGGVCHSNINSIARLVSLSLRGGIKVDEIVRQLKGIICPACTTASVKGEELSGRSCADVISSVLSQEYNRDEIIFRKAKRKSSPKKKVAKAVDVGQLPSQQANESKCPECQEPLRFEGGCQTCAACGWSKCG